MLVGGFDLSFHAGVFGSVTLFLVGYASHTSALVLNWPPRTVCLPIFLDICATTARKSPDTSAQSLDRLATAFALTGASSLQFLVSLGACC